MSTGEISRDDCLRWDAADPLAGFRDRFDLPDGVIYLDGNSLGALPAQTPAMIDRVVRQEWGTGLIRSWNDADWFAKPQVLGDQIAPLIGVGPGQVVVGDSTSICIFQTLLAAVRMDPGRSVIVAERDAFPTDLYMVQSVAELAGLQVRLIDDETSLADALDDQVAVVLLSHVNYRTGELLDMAAVTERIHAVGARVVWDLCHSVGALPVDVGSAGADFAVGCTYKYINGGPGSPAFIYVAPQHQESAAPPLTGWHGHRSPFAFDWRYEPGDGITRFRIGTPSLVAMAGLESALALWSEADLAAVRSKSLALTDLFIALIEARLPDLGEVITPREHARRGSQVAVRVADGYPKMQALIDAGVIGDFRAPDIMRFGFTPLYVSFTDVWDAVERLVEIVSTDRWRDPRYAVRARVT